MSCIGECERPEPLDRRRLAFRKGDGVIIFTIELLAMAVVVGVDLFRLLRTVVVDVRLGRAGAV